MYISRVRITNLRCFSDQTICFTEGLNVIIGENNSGKSTLMMALGLVFNRRTRPSLTIHDFNNRIVRSDRPPSISVEVTLASSGQSDTSEETALVATWLTSVQADWEASLHFVYELPVEHHKEYKEELDKDESDGHFWMTLEKFLGKYVSRIYCGHVEDRIRADAEDLDRFDMRFLEPIRDIESRMFVGSHPLLRRMLIRVLDSNKAAEERDDLQSTFRGNADALVKDLKNRIDLAELFALVDETGASDGGRPDIAGRLTESDLIGTLRLMITGDTGSVPATHNGLGYNNLLYMSLLLKSMELETSTDEYGQNAKIFPILAVEEPEAHLHPSLQYKLIKHLAQSSGVRQCFITTHSTHVTSATSLDSIVCLCADSSGAIQVVYPGKCYPETKDGRASKNYVERFLDATKSSMLFSKGVLFVEGIAEQILAPVIAEYVDRCDLERSHVAVVGIGGQSFKHFLPLFGAGTAEEATSLPRRVACIVDGDPQRRRTQDKRFMRCYPYQIDEKSEEYDYKRESDVVRNLRCQTRGSTNIRVFTNEKTFEYSLAYANPCCDLLITESCTHRERLQRLVQESSEGDEAVQEADEGVRPDLLRLSGLERKQALVATVYLESVKRSKGEHALELAMSLCNNLVDGCAREFEVPAYLRDAFRWVCRMDEEGVLQ